MASSLSPEACYCTKTNIKFPGTQAQATVAETVGAARLNDALPTGVAETVAAGTIKVAS